MSRSSKRLSNAVRHSIGVLALMVAGTSFALASVVAPPTDPLLTQHLETAPLPAQVQPGGILTPGAVPPPPPPPDSAPAATAYTGSVPVLASPTVKAEVKHQLPPREPVAVRPSMHKPWHPPFQRLPNATPAAPKHRERDSARGELRLSNSQLNILRFNQPIRHVWFPAATPLVGKPAYFAQDHAVMLQFEPGVDQTVQIMVELANGTVLSKEARLRSGPGAVLTLSDASGSIFTGQPAAAGSEPEAPDTTGMAAVRLLQSVVQGIIPSGFEVKPLPEATPFQEFLAQPVAFWQNPDEGLRVFVFQLQGKASPAITVTPPEFYRPGVEAVLLTSDTVGVGHSPFLYVVEAYHGE